jgi:hypothetical protein
MKYKEETFVLDTLKELKEKIRDMPLEQLIKETHENNIMLKQIIKVINTWVSHHNQENSNDFDRNVLANFVSNMFDFNKMFKM